MSLPKTVLLFAHNNYYPSGGTLDLHSVHATVEDAMLAADSTDIDEDGDTIRDYDMITVWDYATPAIEYYRRIGDNEWSTQKSDYAKALQRQGF